MSKSQKVDLKEWVHSIEWWFEDKEHGDIFWIGPRDHSFIFSSGSFNNYWTLSDRDLIEEGLSLVSEDFICYQINIEADQILLIPPMSKDRNHWTGVYNHIQKVKSEVESLPIKLLNVEQAKAIASVVEKKTLGLRGRSIGRPGEEEYLEYGHCLNSSNGNFYFSELSAGSRLKILFEKSKEEFIEWLTEMSLFDIARGSEDPDFIFMEPNLQLVEELEDIIAPFQEEDANSSR